MPVLEEVERQKLEAVDQTLSHLQQSLEDAATSGALDTDVLARLAETTKDLASRVSTNLPPHISAEAAAEIRGRLISILTLRIDEASSLDVADQFLTEMEAVRHVLRDLLQEQPPVELRDAQAVIRLLEEWLPGLTVAALADLLGYSERQLQRRRREGGAATSRAQVVARLVAILRHGWTDEGVAAWFYRPRRDLGGDQPIELLDDPGRQAEVLMAARAGRVQVGA